MEEKWVDIPGYEGSYQVSNIGNVKSLERIISRLPTTQYVRERILKQGTHCRGYKHVSIKGHNGIKSQKVHRLVAMAFLGYDPSMKDMVIDHIDGCAGNNLLSNIRVVTRRENTTICFMKNRSTFTSSSAGVSWTNRERRWRARINIDKKEIGLGYFILESDAVKAYSDALIKYNIKQTL